MAFRFQDLAITLSTSTEDYGGKTGPEPKAVVAVAGCGPQSVVMQFGTCAAQTQSPCDTKPDNLQFENGFTQLKGNDLDKLKQALQDMLTEVNTALDELKKNGSVVRNRPCLQPLPPPKPSPAPAPAQKRTSKGKANIQRSGSKK
jgi:hypothetical protein